MKKYFFSFFFLLLLAVAFFYFDFDLSFLQQKKRVFKNFYSQNPVLSMCVYLIVYLLAASFSLPIMSLLTLLGGFLFGTVYGVMLVSTASSIGALISFLLSRFFLSPILFSSLYLKDSLFSTTVKKYLHPTLKIISHKIEKEGAYYLFFLRMAPVFPFFMVNILMGLSPIKWTTFFYLSLIGMLPATVVYVHAGTQFSKVKKISDILSLPVLFAFILLGLLPLMIRLLISRKISVKDG